MKKLLPFVFLSLSFTACKPPSKDPVSALNGLVKEYGYIGWQNPMEESQTGTLIAGRPTAVSFVANYQDCFPEEELPRYFDRSDFNKKYSYTFQGNLGFLVSGNPIVSAGLGLNNNHFVNIELSGITLEYMSSIDITDWYREGMSETCRQYLDDVGFIIQTISSENLKLSISNKRGSNISLDPTNIGQYFQFDFGVNWQQVDEYTIEVTTPKYLGYQLGRLRLDDDERTLYRAMSTEDDRYVFEAISLFDDVDAMDPDQAVSGNQSLKAQNMDDHIYKK